MEYKQEEIGFLKQKIGRTDYENIVKELNEKFNSNRTVDGVRKKLAKLKVNKPIKSTLLFCNKCKHKLGYIQQKQIPFLTKKFGSLKQTLEKYECRKCRTKLK